VASEGSPQRELWVALLSTTRCGLTLQMRDTQRFWFCQFPVFPVVFSVPRAVAASFDRFFYAFMHTRWPGKLLRKLDFLPPTVTGKHFAA
jgi:hypothetical protein